MASDSSPGNLNHGSPSSPDDFTSSPIGNTFSSPGDNRGRRRQRSSTSNYATPPRHRSRLNPTNDATTPTPSRRTGQSQSTPVEGTPSSVASDNPASSEAGDEFDGDDAPSMYVWGTNISVQDVNASIVRFLKNFRDDPVDLESGEIEGNYMLSIRKVLEFEGESIDVDAHHVFDYDPIPTG